MSKQPSQHDLQLPIIAHTTQDGLGKNQTTNYIILTSRRRFEGLVLLSFSVFVCFWYTTWFAAVPRTVFEELDNTGSYFRQSQNWAQYSPYYPVEPYRSPPSNCEVTQVNILQRHGARYPTAGSSKHIRGALKKLLAVRNYTDPQLLFLHNFTYNLGEDDLVPFGAYQSFEAGGDTFQRYAHLVSEDNMPFVRASSEERVVMSATNWTAGFAAASSHKYTPVLSVILPEDANDTLADNMCLKAEPDEEKKAKWLKKYAPPITRRLNAGAPYAKLDDEDTSSLMSLCPFETVATQSPSAFCAVFEDMEDAFSGYEYSGDLDKYYGTGYGGKLGRVQGVGYVNELLARLTGNPVRDHTQTNRTLDSSPETFPLHRNLYADFSHDNEMVAIYTALGLFRPKMPLRPKHPDPKRRWRASRLVPFSARMVVERLECSGRAVSRQYVRILVNQALQPLEFCGSGDGLCTLSDFVESQAYSRSGGEGDWEECFE
ncbi:acid phosphatase [Sparassis latifolia]|uniref:Phytase A n=1 Tax=Sparassis crispa TaxID=139825 RepID=A0A401GDJ9_9APHY|nr:3-phytase B [Sparassis crispa]GBE80211.1 3-phytase B [Sparassis crispa]